MSAIKSFIDSEISRTKALAIAMREDPVITGLSIATQLVAFGIGFWFVIQAVKWSYVTLTSAF